MPQETPDFLSIYVNLMSHHVPGPLDYDVVMTEQVSGPKEPKLLGRHMPSIPYFRLQNFEESQMINFEENKIVFRFKIVLFL